MKQRDLRHLLDRVCEPAQTVLLGQGPLLDRFESTSLEDAFVMSIDIRRSTELMLKAREPQLFADFITELCIQLGGIIVDNSAFRQTPATAFWRSSPCSLAVKTRATEL